MKQIKSVVVSVLVLALCMSFIPMSASAQPVDEVSPRTNYGIACVNCGLYDYMKYIGYEQVGIGGTTHRMIYRCEKCGAVTYWDLQAR